MDEKQNKRIDSMLGKLTSEYENARVFLAAYTGFGVYQPLQQRIKLVMNNIASNREIYGIDSSVAKASENINANGTT